MIRFIIILVILVLALSYFGISIRHIAESPAGVENFSYMKHIIADGWHIILAFITAFAEHIKSVVS